MKSELLTDRMSFWDSLENRIKSSGKSGRALQNLFAQIKCKDFLNVVKFKALKH